MAKRNSANNRNTGIAYQRVKEIPRGYSPRGKVGEERAKLARALGAKSDRALLDQFPPKLRKPVSKILQGFQPASNQTSSGKEKNEQIRLLGELLNSLNTNNPEQKNQTYRQQKADRNFKQLITDQMANTLINMPFILNDEKTNESEKLEKLEIYIEAMEDICETLDLEWIGEINELCKFDPALFESKNDPIKGTKVIVRKPGLKQGDRIVKKAVVEIQK